MAANLGAPRGVCAPATEGRSGDARPGNRDGGPTPPRLIDPAGALCTDTTCFAESDGITYYFDDNHLSAKKSALLKKYFLPSIRDVVDSDSDSDSDSGDR